VCCFTAIIVIANLQRILRTIYANRNSIILSLASLLFIFVLIEVYLRVGDPMGISYYEANARGEANKIADPDLIYGLKPNVRISSRRGGETSYNEFGLRDDPILPKSSSEYRILALGDSVTYGSGVDQDKIFTVRLQQLLSTRLGRRVRVINAGVGGYNTVQELTFLRKTGLSFKPDLILLMYVSNDFEVNKGPFDPVAHYSFKNKSPTEVIEFLLGKSWLYRLAHHAHRYGWLWDRSISYDSVRVTEGWQASMHALENIVDICETHGIPLVVFFWRMKIDPFTSALLEDVRKSVAPFPTQDAGEWFAYKQIRHLVNSQVDGHPNSEGHKITAENMAAYLLNQDFFHNTTFRASTGGGNGSRRRQRQLPQQY
jgi:lysophospholipase L1-like esterase